MLLTAKGPIDKLAVSVTSPNRPDLSESQLYTLIITGHLQLGGGDAPGASPTTQAASIVGRRARVEAAVDAGAPAAARRAAPSTSGGEGIGGTKLEAGRYVTDRLYVGYIGRVGSDPTRYQNRNAVHLEYQLTLALGDRGRIRRPRHRHRRSDVEEELLSRRDARRTCARRRAQNLTRAVERF